MKVNIVGVEIDCYSFDEVVEIIVNRALSKSLPAYVITPNAQHVNNLKNDPLFREIYQHAFLVVPDGVPILWAANFLKTPLKGRVNGTDLFEKLCEVSASKPLKIFLLGGRPGAADLAAVLIESRYPGLKIAGTYCPHYEFESDLEEITVINQKIIASSPNILFVGLGSPKQEKWIYANYKQLKVPVSIAVGVSFELVSGMVKRAPSWMQKSGLEWLFRLMVEPRRLWKRYILGNPTFIWRVLQQRLSLPR
jgi:N-acetylglucosaminyldiphosphoundecaprenol N-acetyl-beta-D-mannosaminyltransferase